MRSLALALMLALVACATQLPQIVEREGDTFDVRYDAAVQSEAEIDAKANTHCANGAAGYVSQQTGFDGFAYRTYRCVTRRAGPQTVSVALGADSDAIAQRECGGPARPETVHHESNVITYRCIGGAS
jgi:hypothetical protein